MELNQRERMLLIVAAVVLLPLLIFQFGLFPLFEYQSDLEEKIVKTRKNLVLVEDLGKQLKTSRVNKGKRNTNLERRVDNLLSQVKIRNKTEIVVDDRYKEGQKLVLKMNEINLTQLVSFIYKVENQKPGIFIESFESNPSFQNEKLLRVNLSLISE